MKKVEVIYLLGYDEQQIVGVDNTLKYIGEIHTLVSINEKINYDTFIKIVCSRLDIDQNCNNIHKTQPPLMICCIQ